jgi:hypothetical protein
MDEAWQRGLRSACYLLVGSYEPPVARAVARCWLDVKERLGYAFRRTYCMKQGFAAACVDEAHRPTCRAIVSASEAQHKRIAYTEDDCVRVLSSFTDDEDVAWAAEEMAPKRHDRFCRLAYFQLPF